MTTVQAKGIGQAYRGKRVMVLGATGFIGRWVARGLTQSSAEVTVAVRDAAAFAGIAERWNISADVLSADDASSILSAVREVAPDVVFNLIGYGIDRGESDPDLMWATNRDLVRQVAVALDQLSKSRPSSQNRRFVHVGSALEYGLLDGIATEWSVTEPHTVYGQTKLAGTNALRAVASETGLNAVTARAFTVFGPGEHQGRLLPSIRRAAIGSTSVRLSAGTQLRDFCYVEDVAEGLLRLGLSDYPAGAVVNLASGRMHSVREFAETAATVLKLSSDLLEFGAEPVRKEEMRITGVDVGRLQAWIGWRPPGDLEPGLTRAAEFEARLTR